MPVALLVDNPNGSQEVYDKVREHIGLDAPAGGIFHAAGPSPNGGWRVIRSGSPRRTPAGSSPRNSSLRSRLPESRLPYRSRRSGRYTTT